MEIKFEDIQKANDTIKTTGIERKDKNGKTTIKEYAEVNQRIKAFRMVYPDGLIDSEMIYNNDGICIFRAKVGYYTDEDDGFGIRWLGYGHAYEKENSSFINKTSYIENCETSAIGRALGMAGFGIDTSIASAEEVENAILQQDGDKIISATKVKALEDSIKNNMYDVNGIDKEILDKYGYKELKEIKMKDYMKIVEDFKNIKEK
jgi:hypothetical protein